MSVPEVEGIVLAGVVEDLVRLREQGGLGTGQLEGRLESEDLALREEKVDPTRWYPVAGSERMLEPLFDVEGHRHPAYLQRRGMASAQRLIAAGVYQQLNALERAEVAESQAEFAHRVRRTASLQVAMLRLGDWQLLDDPDNPGRMMIEVLGATAFPELLRIALEGFLTAASRVRGSRIRWASERPDPARIRFRMDRDYTGRDAPAPFDANPRAR